MKSGFSIPNWCIRHPILFMVIYTVFYLNCFSFLQSLNLSSHFIIRCHLDSLIPFCKYAIIPYSMWFLWIPFTLFFILLKGSRLDFWRLCLPLFLGMTIALILYYFFPNGLALRPHSVPGDDFFARAVQILYKVDPPCNVCPSIHVFNSVTICFAYLRCDCFKLPGRRWMRPAATLLCLAIICSTMLLKQHSVIDVVLGIALALILDRIATKVAERYSQPVAYGKS